MAAPSTRHIEPLLPIAAAGPQTYIDSGFGIVSGLAAGLSQKIAAAARSLVVPGSRTSRRGALPQRILR